MIALSFNQPFAFPAGNGRPLRLTGVRIDWGPMQLTVTSPTTFAWAPVHPRPPETGEVWMRTRLSAISFSSELFVIEQGPFPATLGYQTLGTVEQVGPGVTLRPGTRVVSTLGHASAGLLDAARVLPVPDHVPDRVALAAVLGEETHKGIRRVAPQPGERVVVAGGGLLGLLTVFNLTRRGITDVTVIEPDSGRRTLAELFGAVAVSPGALPHDTFDVGFECSASPAGFAELVAHLRPRGRACVLSDGNWGALMLPPNFHRRPRWSCGGVDQPQGQLHALTPYRCPQPTELDARVHSPRGTRKRSKPTCRQFMC